MKHLYVRLPDDLHARLVAHASHNMMPQAVAVRQALAQFLGAEDRKQEQPRKRTTRGPSPELIAEARRLGTSQAREQETQPPHRVARSRLATATFREAYAAEWLRQWGTNAPPDIRAKAEAAHASARATLAELEADDTADDHVPQPPTTDAPHPSAYAAAPEPWDAGDLTPTGREARDRELANAWLWGQQEGLAGLCAIHEVPAQIEDDPQCAAAWKAGYANATKED